MNREDAIITLTNTASLLRDGTRHMKPEHEKQFREAYEMAIKALTAQPEIIRCKDCRWWDKYGDYDNGYCMAVKHGYWDEHWDISIRRTYKGDFYCADAEPKGEQE